MREKGAPALRPSAHHGRSAIPGLAHRSVRPVNGARAHISAFENMDFPCHDRSAPLLPASSSIRFTVRISCLYGRLIPPPVPASSPPASSPDAPRWAARTLGRRSFYNSSMGWGTAANRIRLSENLHTRPLPDSPRSAFACACRAGRAAHPGQGHYPPLPTPRSRRVAPRARPEHARDSVPGGLLAVGRELLREDGDTHLPADQWEGASQPRKAEGRQGVHAARYAPRAAQGYARAPQGNSGRHRTRPLLK